MIDGKDKMGRVWHPFWVRCCSARYPGVSRGSTPGYYLATRRVARSPNPTGWQKVVPRGGIAARRGPPATVHGAPSILEGWKKRRRLNRSS
jgi:hypothetical protein